MIDFENELRDLGYRGMHFSEQSGDSINNYLFRGLMPGGHLEAQFAHDMERALYNADTHNRTVFWAIAMWIRNNAPAGSQGSYEAVKAWCNNVDDCRSKWVTWRELTHTAEPKEPLF